MSDAELNALDACLQAAEIAGMRAMSNAELNALDIANASKTAQRGPFMAAEIAGMANYRPPVSVPPGFAEWFKYGGELV